MMRFSNQVIAVSVIASTVALVVPAAAADNFTVDSWGLRVYAEQGLRGNGDFSDNITVVNPFNDSLIIVQGGSICRDDYDFAWDAFGGAFNVAMSHQLDGSQFSFVFSTGRIRFTVANVDMQYDISGLYSMTGENELATYVELLKDGTRVFEWQQISTRTADESFVVGDATGGDFDNLLIGSPSGTLEAGHSYELRYQFEVLNSSADAGVAAMGELHLTITGPEPTELTQDLILDVVVLNLQNGIANNLDAKLDAVVRALDDLNANNDVAACNALGGFINAVEGQSGNHIPVEDAAALILSTQQIRALLGCTP